MDCGAERLYLPPGTIPGYLELEKETGQATGWISKGSLSIATNEDRLAHIRRQESLAHLYGLRANSIEIEEVRERMAINEYRRCDRCSLVT